MKKVAGKLRLELAQYREMAAFAQFGSDLDKATQLQLARGERMTELLKQSQYSPLRMEEQVVILFAGTNGFVDDYPVDVLLRYEKELLNFLRGENNAILDSLRSTGKLDDTMEKGLRDALTEFAKTFSVESKG
jgi:F-type H+-transporting ATPase subunit alpha